MSVIDRDGLLARLHERLAAEEAGGELYDVAVEHARREQDLGQMIERLVEVRATERRHAELLRGLIRSLGGDPARAAGAGVTASLHAIAGLVELCRRPGASLADILQALQAVELLDHAGWDLLCELSDDAELGAAAGRSLRAARDEEAAHVELLRRQVEALAREELTLASMPTGVTI